jgi:hypothetical protein
VKPQRGQTILHLISCMTAPQTQQRCTSPSAAIPSRNGIVSAMSRRLQAAGARAAGARVGAWLLAISLLGAGCASVTLDAVRADVAEGHGHLIGDVPFIPQETYQCGPAALAMVLRYWGAPTDASELAHELLLPSARGVLNLELEFQARRRGFRTLAFQGTLERVRAELRHGRPLIVFQDLGAGPVSVPHFAVLLGFDDRAGVVVLHSGATPYRVLSYPEFLRTWEARRRWTLLVTPPDAPA